MTKSDNSVWYDAQINSRQQNRRLMKELRRIMKKPIPNIQTCPLESNILEWHFVLHGTNGPYEGGTSVNYMNPTACTWFNSMFQSWHQPIFVDIMEFWNFQYHFRWSLLQLKCSLHLVCKNIALQLAFVATYHIIASSCLCVYCTWNTGRFKTNTRICLSMSDFHAELWNPGWNVETILIGLLSFM